MLACVLEYVDNGTLEDHLRISSTFSNADDHLDVGVMRGWKSNNKRGVEEGDQLVSLADQWIREAQGGHIVHSWESIDNDFKQQMVPSRITSIRSGRMSLGSIRRKSNVKVEATSGNDAPVLR